MTTEKEIASTYNDKELFNKKVAEMYHADYEVKGWNVSKIRKQTIKKAGKKSCPVYWFTVIHPVTNAPHNIRNPKEARKWSEDSR